MPILVITMDLRALGKIVSRRPLAVLIIILLITTVFGYYTSQMKMSADLETFLPEDEMINALMKINDEFGSTDIMEIVITDNNTVSKESLEDMLKLKQAILENKGIVKNLKTPNSPEDSVLSPADVIILGSITLSFQEDMKKNLVNMTSILQNMNLTPFEELLRNMNMILMDYGDIYHNATEIREDAKNIVLLLFIQPRNGETDGLGSPEVKMLIENVTKALLSTSDFKIKSKVLTLLTPPPINGTSGENMVMDENATHLMNRFLEDMSSSLPIDEKEISVRYFTLTLNNFTLTAMHHSASSMEMAINQSAEILQALNSTENALLAGLNDTAILLLDQLINQSSHEIMMLSSLLPYYQQVNDTLSAFLNKYENNQVQQEDVEALREALNSLIPYTQGEEKELWRMFLETLDTWDKHRQIGYDLLYEGNTTLMLCRGFVENYQGVQMLKDNLENIKMMINNSTTIETVSMIEIMKNILSEQMEDMEDTKKEILEALNAMESSIYLNWFFGMLSDLDYVLLHSPITGNFAVNIFNMEMEMMASSSQGGVSPAVQIFYNLKHAFDSSVSDIYKNKIEDMFLREMQFMQMGQIPEMDVKMPEISVDMPNFEPTVKEEKAILENMSNSDIVGTIGKMESYDPSDFISTVDSAIQVINSTLVEMEKLRKSLDSLIANMKFVYQTTENQSIQSSLLIYQNMSSMFRNMSSGLSDFNFYLPSLGGFATMMSQLSSQLKSMFSKDFTGDHAKAAMMIVMLNSTYLPGESQEEHSDRMEMLEEKVQNVALSTPVHGKVMVMGSSLISKATEKTANEIFNILLPVSVLLVIIILTITFRSILDTFLGLLGLGMAILWAYGFGVIVGYNFNQIVTTVAVLLVGLGIDYAIHTILRYREELRKGRHVREAMEEMITHLGMGLILATITTIVAFLSNVSSPIPPVANFGVMNAVGIFGAFVIFTTFIPAVKILIDSRREKKGKLKIKKEKEREGSGVILLNKLMATGAVGAEKHRHVVLAIVIAVSLVAAYGGMNLDTTFDVKDFLPSNLEISHTIEFMMNNFNSSALNDEYVLVEGDITTPSVLEAVRATMENLKDDELVDYPQSESIYTLIEKMKEKNTTFARIVLENDTNGDGMPDKNIEEIYQWLYDNTDEGKRLLHKNKDGEFDIMLITVRSYADTDKEYRILSKEINEDIKPLKDMGIKVIPTGTGLLTYHIIDLLQGSQWNSLIITLIASLIVLTVIFFLEKRSYVLGTITMLPVIISLLWILGTMYFMGMSFNVVTVTITSLTIGLGITYAIHITHRFLEDWEKEKDILEALKKTVRHTGTSVFGAAATTMAGFGTLGLSSMPPIRQFGEISAISIFYSFLLSVFILPTFLYFWAKWKENRSKS